MHPLARFGLPLAMLVAAHAAAAQAVYTCVDAKGRRLTADRPIMECLDREQQVIGAGGRVQRIGPSLTAEERAAEEDKARRAQEEQQRIAEERRRDRSLLNRYPSEEEHRKERKAALQRVEDTMAMGSQRLVELQEDRKRLLAEQAKGGDAAQKARVQRALEQNQQDEAAQQRLLAGHVEEKRRIDARFDEELRRLRPLWAEAAARTAAVRRPASAAAAR